MYKAIRCLNKINWTKSLLLRTNINVTEPAPRTKGNGLRLLRKVFKSSAREKIARSVT